MSLKQLTDELQEGPQLPVHLYVVASVGLEEGKFNKVAALLTNFQGSMITLCACKHPQCVKALVFRLRALLLRASEESGVETSSI